MSLKWDGRNIRDKVERASVTGINKVMARAAIHAKSHHPWVNRTGTLEGSLDIINYAQRNQRRVSGTWGSRDVVYALPLEFKGFAYLRPAADATYASLASEIRKEYER